MTYIAESLIEIKLQKLIKQFKFELKRHSASYSLILPENFSIKATSMSKIATVLKNVEWDILAYDNKLVIDIPFVVYDASQQKMIPNTGI